MKKILLGLLLVVLTVLTACTNESNELETIKIGVDFYPMPQIMEIIYDDLKNDGIQLEVISMNYNNLNLPLHQGEIDGNLVQHEHFMNFFNQANHAKLVVAKQMYHSKFAIFSRVYNNLDEIVNGETVHLPADVVNLSRALILLEANNLIKLKDGITKTSATLDDIVENKKELKFEVSSINVTPLKYQDSGHRLAIMYPTYLLQSLGDVDANEYLVNEELNDLTKTYAISFVVNEDKLNTPLIQKFIKHLTSDKVKNYLETNYGWAAEVAF